ncbi:AhpD family alkylhydroperoxidase [Actinoalloteichus hoggarensis]|uniref:Carboxymuconolactone decarboxylase family protein n=1 Tax=Actinoalloteichus hoggarensis TaxID=1470176 RepID=A0A221VYH9_9PSEU|nr:carboxymuconolactone decarboxylase family protein [Actinoalloteichus hoggarensis]ASO18301.1 Carboxymuconolactone decarboxylase family protein [Actinoalloteichus hoggarensis]MBB5921663.1 AhpD family alkylhydroperoxidase [Actinoalloteichus hoggarensis]
MPRLVVPEHAPAGYRAVGRLDQYLRDSIDAGLLDVVKLRASQLNGCAYCVDMHAASLSELGVPARKIHALPVWRETDFFSDRERAALALTEAITVLTNGVDDDVWAQAAAQFDERELADLVLAIGTINLLNRIGVSTRLAPPPLAR